MSQILSAQPQGTLLVRGYLWPPDSGVNAALCTLQLPLGRTAYGPCDWPPGLPIFSFATSYRRSPGYSLHSSRANTAGHLGALFCSPAIGGQGCLSSASAPILAYLQACTSQRLVPGKTKSLSRQPASTLQPLVSGAACLPYAHQSLPYRTLIGHHTTNWRALLTPPVAHLGSARGGAVATGGGGGGGDASQSVSERGGHRGAQGGAGVGRPVPLGPNQSEARPCHGSQGEGGRGGVVTAASRGQREVRAPQSPIPCV